LKSELISIEPPEASRENAQVENIAGPRRGIDARPKLVIEGFVIVMERYLARDHRFGAP
jgi:hypothetical protein